MEIQSLIGLIVKIEVINIISVRLRTKPGNFRAIFICRVESNQTVTLDLVLVLLGFEIELVVLMLRNWFGFGLDTTLSWFYAMFYVGSHGSMR